jgi:hypothetical protein
MKAIDVTIEAKGKKQLLMHNPAGMGKGRDPKGKIPSAEQEAAASCYWTSDGTSLMCPGSNILRGLIIAARAFKVGKVAVAPYVAGAIEIEPEEIPFGTKEYEIDTRRAVVQRQGIMRSRAKLTNWSLSFTLLVADEDLPPKSYPLLRAILEELGRRIGILDYRPEKSGPFGRFAVTKWEER